MPGTFERLEPRRLLSDVIAVGPEFRVNTYTTDSQGFCDVAGNARGDFVVAWKSRGQDGSGYGVYAQRYDAAGVAQGPEFLVNTFTTGHQSTPSVGMDADGNFVIAWHGEGQAGPSNSVYAQRYNDAGERQGAEFRVGTIAGGTPSVAMDEDGDFVVAWAGAGEDDPTGGIYAQRYDELGVPQGTQFRANTYTTSAQSGPTVATDSDGDFIIVWQSYFQDGSFFGIYAQRYDVTGTPQSTEFRVNTFTSAYQWFPQVAMKADGDFNVAWTMTGVGVVEGIYAQRYDASGLAQGGEFAVGAATTDRPSIAMDRDGNFVVTWRYGIEVHARRYDGAGLPQGGEFRVNANTTSSTSFPVVEMNAVGDFVVAWHTNGQDGSGLGIFAQRYAVVPEVTTSSFHFATAPQKMSFTFDRDVSASLGTDDLVVQNLTTMQTIPSSDFSVSYDTITNVATFTYTGTTAGILGMLPDGNYSATLIASGITTIQGAPLANDYVQIFRFLQGDADGDGRVNLQDFNILAANFGQSPRDFTQGDFNYDTIVNLNDFNILASRFGQVLAAASARPMFEGWVTDTNDDIPALI